MGVCVRVLVCDCTCLVCCAKLQTLITDRQLTITHSHTQIRVYCRVKPHPTPVMRCLPDQIGVSIGVDGKEHGFGYDRVFNPTEGQEEVREREREPLANI